MSIRVFGSEIPSPSDWFSRKKDTFTVQPATATRDTSSPSTVEAIEKKHSEEETAATQRLVSLIEVIKSGSFDADLKNYSFSQLADTMEAIMLFYPPAKARYHCPNDDLQYMTHAYSATRDLIRNKHRPSLNVDDPRIVEALRAMDERMV